MANPKEEEFQQNAEVATIKNDHQQKAQLHDYVIKVEDTEFRVNKVALASKSSYFQAMFDGGWNESKTDKVELPGLKAEVVSEILDFLCTGKEEVFKVPPAETLECAVYLQMPTIIQYCVKKLHSQLRPDNCLDMLSLFVSFALEDAVQHLKNYLRSIWESGNIHEWYAFFVVQTWAHPYSSNKTSHINELMSDIRFSLMSKEEIEAIQKSAVYADYEGTWHDLVTAAVEYTNLPVHLRVINQAEQSTVRSAPRPTFFTTGEREVPGDESTAFSIDPSTFFTLVNDSFLWLKREKEAVNTPMVTDGRPLGIVVNNFFVICTGSETNPEWYIFDPRTLMWSQIANMPRPKMEFAMVHHKGHIYVIGGSYIVVDDSETEEDIEIEATRETEKYTFQTNEWTSILPFPDRWNKPTACVIGDIVYACDWRTLYSLDLSSEDQRWEEKDSCLDNKVHQPMHVMTYNGEQVIVVIHLSGSTSGYGDEIHIYSPAQNQWSMLEHPFTKRFDKIFRGDDAMAMSDGNSVYLLSHHGFNGDVEDFEELKDNDSWTVEVCLKWVIPETGSETREVSLAGFPISDEGMWAPAMNTFGALLAIAPNYQ